MRMRPVVATALAVAVAAVVTAALPGGWMPAFAGAAWAQAARPDRAAASSITISVVGTSDLHGAIIPTTGNRGGLALFGGYLSNLRAARARDGGGVLLLDAGDIFQGTLESNHSEGASVVAAYNVLGYGAAAIGNHEFDFGPVGPLAIPGSAGDDPRGALKARAAEAAFPFLAANLIDEDTGQPPDWTNVRPSTLVEVAGVKVGVIGVMTRNALSATIAANTRGLRVAPLAATIASEARHLRSQGAIAVVVAAHAGGSCTSFERPRDLSSCDVTAEIVSVARDLPPGLVDAMVAGHTHAGMAHEVNGIAITQALSNGRAFGRVDLTIGPDRQRVASARIHAPREICGRAEPATGACIGIPTNRLRPASYEGRAVTPDTAIAAVLAPAVAAVEKLKARPVGVTLLTAIERGQGGESALGNLFSDAFRESVPGADLAINNTFGGLRADLPDGPLTYGDLFRTFPFDNRLVTLRLTGAQIRRVVSDVIGSGNRVPGFSGLRVRAACGDGGLQVRLLRASGAPVRDDETLTVVTTDFIALGGDRLLTGILPPQGFPIDPAAPIARDVVAESLGRRGGRLRASDFIDAANPRWVAPAGRGACRG